jgi:hypothetical protein
VSYLKKPTLPQQQNELREFIEQRLQNEDTKLKERVYQWLSDNQYFTDNELFDFYFCVAQNLAAVEVLGASGEQIVKVQTELENQLNGILDNQQKLDNKLVRVFEELTIEQQNLKTISTGLVNSTAVLLKKQQQLSIQTEAASKTALTSVMVAWIIPVITLLGCLAMLLIDNSILENL